jgi:hypothetical protein
MVLLRKPSEYFKEDGNISVENSVKNLAETGEVEVNTFSEAFNLFKENISKIETLSEYSETLDDYKLNIEKVNFLSEKIESIETEIQNFLTRKDLDIAVMSQLFVVEQSIKDIQSKVKSINQRTLTEIRLDASNLTKVVNNFINDEVPKYRKSLVETEVRTSNLCRELEDTVNQTVSDINEFVDNKYEEVSGLIVEINESIVRNESYLKSRNQTLEDLQEHILTTFSEINLEKIEKKNRELSKKIRYIEEVFEKFDENKILNENLLSEPPSTTNQDPLTPLDKNFVTLDQLQEHYRLFINRIQQQLASIGGSGETKLKYLDDIVGIATNPSVYDGKFLRYYDSKKSFEFSEVVLDYASASGYASTAGIATYAPNAGVATYAPNAGIATYAPNAGIATYAPNAGIATYAPDSGISTALKTQRDFSISGDVATASSVSFNGTSNVNLSVALSTNFSANTLGIITASQFSTGLTGIGINTDTISGPSIIFIDPSPVGVGTTSGIVRIKGDLYVDGTQFVVNSSTIELADLRVGIATTVGTNLLLHGGGIGIGSANILKTFTYNSASDSLKSSENLDIVIGKTYKIDGTDALSSTTLGSGVTNSSLTSVGKLINLSVDSNGISTLGTVKISSGTIESTTGTAVTFIGNLTGIASTATNVIGGIASVANLRVTGISTFGNASIGIKIDGTTGIITSNTGTAVTFFGNLTGTATTAGFAQTAFSLDTTATSKLNVAFAQTAGIATNLKGSDVNVIPYQAGINSTSFLPTGSSGNFLRSNGSGAAPSWVTLPSSSIGIDSIGNNTSQFPLFVTGIGSTGSLGVNTSLFSFVPQSTNPRLGIGTGDPKFNLDVNGNGRFTGIVSASNLVISGLSTFGNSTTGIKIDGTTGIITSNTGTAVTFVGNLTGTASTASFATTSTNVIGGIASVSSLFVNTLGISTLGIVVISAGIITATSSGIVTYFGDGSKLSNIGASISTNTSNQAQFITYVTGTGATSGLGVTTAGLVFNPSSNSLGIGTTNPTSKLYVNGDVFVTGIITSTDFNSASDIRLKENIQKIDNPIDKIIRIEGVTFDWKSSNKSSMGVIAQNIEKVLPQLVNGEDSKTVNYNGIIGLLIECVKTQQEQIDNLNIRLDDLSK